jgi:hypothetical protein
MAGDQPPLGSEAEGGGACWAAGEYYTTAGKVSKWADKWGKAGPNVWHEKWGEDYQGACVRGTCECMGGE